MPQIRPISDLRDTNMISEICHAKDEPVYITKNGYGDLVVMSMETFEQLFEQQTTDCAIAAAEAGFEKDGKLIDAREALSQLRRKHFG